MNYKWILRISCLLQIASIGILWVFEAVRMKDLGIGETTIGAILGFGSGVFIVGSLFWGRLADRKHWHKPIALAGSIAIALTMLYFSICQQVWQFALYAAVKSFASPMIMGMMPALAFRVFGNEGRGRSFGVYRAFGSFGFMIGTMALPLLLNNIALVARAGSLLIFFSIFLVRRLPEPETNPTSIAPLGFRGLNPVIKLFLVSFFFIALAEPAVHAFFTAYVRQLGGSTRLLGLFSGMMGLVALITLPIMGKLIDRLNPAYILSVSFLVQPLRVCITSFIGDAEMLWIPILLHGICWGGIEVAAIVYLSSLAKEGHKATVLSYYLAVRMLGQLFGAMISGYLAENIGYIFMFRTMASAALLGALIYIAGTYWPRKVFLKDGHG